MSFPIPPPSPYPTEAQRKRMVEVWPFINKWILSATHHKHIQSALQYLDYVGLRNFMQHGDPDNQLNKLVILKTIEMSGQPVPTVCAFGGVCLADNDGLSKFKSLLQATTQVAKLIKKKIHSKEIVEHNNNYYILINSQQ